MLGSFLLTEPPVQGAANPGNHSVRADAPSAYGEGGYVPQSYGRTGVAGGKDAPVMIEVRRHKSNSTLPPSSLVKAAIT